METSKGHKNYVRYILLALAIALVIVIWSAQQPRYAVSGTSGSFVILDTRTGELWGRRGNYVLRYGTLENPRYVIDTRVKTERIRPAPTEQPTFYKESAPTAIVPKPGEPNIPRPSFEDFAPVKVKKELETDED